MSSLIFATMNEHKLSEARQIIGDLVNLSSPIDFNIIGEIPETGSTLEENAGQKARYIWDLTATSCFSDDTGLEIEALNGEPGVFSARYAGEGKSSTDNMNKVLELMRGKVDRRARFRCVVALIINGEQHLFEGVINGIISDVTRGNEGFGYDPIFIPDGYNISFAEISPEKKNLLSHRGMALRKMKDFLISKVYL